MLNFDSDITVDALFTGVYVWRTNIPCWQNTNYLEFLFCFHWCGGVVWNYCTEGDRLIVDRNLSCTQQSLQLHQGYACISLSFFIAEPCSSLLSTPWYTSGVPRVDNGLHWRHSLLERQKVGGALPCGCSLLQLITIVVCCVWLPLQCGFFSAQNVSINHPGVVIFQLNDF